MEQVSVGEATLALLGAVLLGGCVHNERYPESWEPVRAGAATDCADVAATYTNEGENSNGDRILLAGWLGPRKYNSDAEHDAFQSDVKKAQTVQLQIAGNILKFVASGNNIHREWSFDSTKREFECKHGVVRIRRFEVASDIVVLVGKGSDYLYRVGDHLVVKKHSAEVGLLLVVIPVAGVGTSWARFAVIPSPSVGQ